MEKREHLCNVGGSVNWNSLYGKQCGGSSKKKFKIELPYDPEILLWGNVLEENENTNLKKDVCTPMFIVVVFIIAKIRK